MTRTMMTMTMTALALTTALTACKGDAEGPRTGEHATAPAPASTATTAALTGDAAIARGKYLVSFAGCHDCHTPLKMGPTGPAPDMERALSGHPAALDMPPAPTLPPGPWLTSVAATNTAWAGPWGVSFTANLTPDLKTGLGTWTTENFVATIRQGRHMGAGRPLLPPMPAAQYASMTDEDLGAVFAYLKTLPAIENKVPAPRPPVTAAIVPATPSKMASK